MAKNRNKKKAASATMDIDASTSDRPVTEIPQAMDMSETTASKTSVGGQLRKMKKGRPMKRSQNMRKMKAIAKAISETEKLEERSVKTDSKTMRTKLSKNLYD